MPRHVAVPVSLPLLPELVGVPDCAANHFRRLGLLPAARGGALASEVGAAWAGSVEVDGLRRFLAAHAVRMQTLEDAAGLYPSLDGADDAGVRVSRAA